MGFSPVSLELDVVSDIIRHKQTARTIRTKCMNQSYFHILFLTSTGIRPKDWVDNCLGLSTLKMLIIR